VPVLARIFEVAGLSTVVVTNMPFWSDRVGAPRSLGVDFPFGHIIGPAGDSDDFCSASCKQTFDRNPKPFVK
jgi:hypothetical protein